MRGYIIHADKLTQNYHSDGSVLVFAESLEDAKLLVPNKKSDNDWQSDVEITDAEWAEATVFEVASPPEQRVWFFPDAGCC